MHALHPTVPIVLGKLVAPLARRHYTPALLVAVVLLAAGSLFGSLKWETADANEQALPGVVLPASTEIDPFAAEKKNALIEELPAQF